MTILGILHPSGREVHARLAGALDVDVKVFPFGALKVFHGLLVLFVGLGSGPRHVHKIAVSDVLDTVFRHLDLPFIFPEFELSVQEIQV